MAEEAVCCEPVSPVKLPDKWQITGNFFGLIPDRRFLEVYSPLDSKAYPKIPWTKEQGIPLRRTGRFHLGTGNFQPGLRIEISKPNATGWQATLFEEDEIAMERVSSMASATDSIQTTGLNGFCQKSFELLQILNQFLIPNRKIYRI